MIRISNKLGRVVRYFGAAKADESLKRVPTPTCDKEIRDKLHLEGSEKYYLYELNKKRSIFSLYNLFSKLPMSVVKTFGTLAADQSQTSLQSDKVHFPKLTKNGVPIYESISLGTFLICVRSIDLLPLPLLLFFSHFLWLNMFVGTLALVLVYQPTLLTMAKRSVIKMELIPESEELLIQKVGLMGYVNTLRVKINDVEYVDREQLEKNNGFHRFANSFLDKRMIFRIKSSGETLMFDRQGVWFEEGLNHPLVI